jgi:hypothetical protein
VKRIGSILAFSVLSVACGREGHRGPSQNIGAAPVNTPAAVVLDQKQSREIVIELFKQKAFYEPAEEQIVRYEQLLKARGQERLWEEIVLADHKLIVNDRIRALTGEDKPDDLTKNAIEVLFINYKDTAQLDSFIRSFYLSSKDPDKSAPSLPPPASRYPECNIHTMSTWEYYDCIDKGE